MTVRGALLLILVFLVLPGAEAAVYLAGLPFADAFDLLNFTGSIFAYFWLLGNVLLSLKLPVLQNSLPYDARVRVHVWTSGGLALFLAWHGVYTIFLRAKDIDLVSWTLATLFAGLLVFSLLWVPLPGFRRLRKTVAGAFRAGVLPSYELFKDVHKVLFAVLALLTYVHIVQAEITAQVPFWWGLGYPAAAGLAAAAWLAARWRNRRLPVLTVRSVRTEGGIVRLGLEPNPRLRYRAGQFAFLRFEEAGLAGEEHPFSFTSAPHEPSPAFAIRALGDFTAKIAALEPGDRVRINGGFGAFFPRSGREPLALIGSGIGAAPLVSLLKDLAHRQPDREVICLLSVGQRDELLEPEALAEVRSRMPRLTLKTLIFAEDGELYGPALFQRELREARRFQYYLCSSDRVRSIVVGALTDLGVPRGRIHFEAFSLG